MRLGYAATEHGYEAATVTAGIELASAATTRRGLYVGITRGPYESLSVCVITESDDVAEARDVLEGILAVDRADIPAVTQRRNLAAQQPPSAGAYRRHRISHADVRSRSGSASYWPTPDALSPKPSTPSNRTTVERTRRAAAVTAAENDLKGIDRATAPHRERLAIDMKRADHGPADAPRGAASPPTDSPPQSSTRHGVISTSPSGFWIGPLGDPGTNTSNRDRPVRRPLPRRAHRRR